MLVREKGAGGRSDSKPEGLSSTRFFDSLPEIMKPEAVAELLGVSVKTIYDWRYRQKLRGVPEGLFLKFNRLLYLRTEVLKQWIRSQNPSLQ